ncbi:restriction endonuclease subunit S [Methylobacterium sp. SI9]|uniref:restriction endonuclease subunit S n=1 Tax=Methylobacterium guangdongense TaxID=3138811 RepID=UPI00313E7CC0
MPNKIITSSRRLLSLAQVVDLSATRVDPKSLPASPFIGLEHIEPRKMRLKSIGSSEAVTGSVYRFQPGDVLYGRMRPNLAKVFQPDFEGVCSTEIFVLRSKPSMDQDLLPFILMTRSFTTFATAAATGDRPRVRFQDLVRFEVTLPELDEQRRMIATLRQGWTDLLAAQDLLDDLPKAVAAYRAEVLASAFRGQLTAGWRESHPSPESADLWTARIAAMRSNGGNDEAPTSARRPPYRSDGAGASSDVNLPRHWCKRPLGYLFDIQVGSTPSRRDQSYWNGNIPWVSSGEIKFNRIQETRERITESGLAGSSTKLHPPGTVLVAMIGEGRTRGQAAILDIAAANSQNSAAILIPAAEILPEYVFYFLESNYEETRKLGAGNSQRALNKARVAGIFIPMAPTPEASEIVNEIEKRLDLLAGVLQRVALAADEASELGAAFLENALSGNIEVISPLLADLTSNVAPELPAVPREPRKNNESSSMADGRKPNEFRSKKSPSSQSGSSRNLGDLLLDAGGELTPEKLFELSDFGVEEVENFYLALRREIRAGAIEETRLDASRVVLRHGYSQ